MSASVQNITSAYQVQMFLLSNGHPVTTVMLGEDLELRWLLYSSNQSIIDRKYRHDKEFNDYEKLTANKIMKNNTAKHRWKRRSLPNFKLDKKTDQKVNNRIKSELKSNKNNAKNTIQLSKTSLYGFSVDNCTAERLGGNPPNPPPLSLIVNG